MRESRGRVSERERVGRERERERERELGRESERAGGESWEE